MIFYDPSLLSQCGAVLLAVVEVWVLGQGSPLCTHGYIWLKLALLSWVGLWSPFVCTGKLQNACEEKPKGSCQGSSSSTGQRAAEAAGTAWVAAVAGGWKVQELDEVQDLWSLQEGFICTLYIYHSSVRRRSIKYLSWVRRCHGPWHLLANVLSTPPFLV